MILCKLLIKLSPNDFHLLSSCLFMAINMVMVHRAFIFGTIFIHLVMIIACIFYHYLHSTKNQVCFEFEIHHGQGLNTVRSMLVTWALGMKLGWTSYFRFVVCLPLWMYWLCQGLSMVYFVLYPMLLRCMHPFLRYSSLVQYAISICSAGSTPVWDVHPIFSGSTPQGLHHGTSPAAEICWGLQPLSPS